MIVTSSHQTNEVTLIPFYERRLKVKPSLEMKGRRYYELVAAALYHRSYRITQ